MFNRKDVDFNDALQAIDAWDKFLKLALSSAERAKKQVTIQSIGKSGYYLTVRGASESSDASESLQSGTIVEIEMLQVLKQSCENHRLQHSVTLNAKLKLSGFNAKSTEVQKANA